MAYFPDQKNMAFFNAEWKMAEWFKNIKKINK